MDLPFLPRGDDAIALIAALVDLKPVCFGPAASAPSMAAPSAEPCRDGWTTIG